jgi:hypothetical protein
MIKEYVKNYGTLSGRLRGSIPTGTDTSIVSATGGRISVVGIDPGSCSVELDQGNPEHIVKVSDRCKSSGLATQNQHKILLDLASEKMGSG